MAGTRMAEIKPVEVTVRVTLVCAACDRPFDEHCRKHLIPCCPGKCRDELLTSEEAP